LRAAPERRSTGGRVVGLPPGKTFMPALEGGPSALEKSVLGTPDPDRMNQLGECLFTLNSRRFGPIPGAYVVVCVEPERRWCVGQLSADRARPLVMFDDLMFSDPALAQEAAEGLRTARGEGHPQRSI
jgi:hypothetical protein